MGPLPRRGVTVSTERRPSSGRRGLPGSGAFAVGLLCGCLAVAGLLPLVEGDRTGSAAGGTVVAGARDAGGNDLPGDGYGRDETMEGQASPEDAAPTAGSEREDSPASPRAGTDSAPAPGSSTHTGTAASGIARDLRVGFLLLDLGNLGRIGVQTQASDTETQRKVMQVFVDDINARGGIKGRVVRPYYRAYDVTSAVRGWDDMRSACLELTEDHKVFVVLDHTAFFGPPALCITEEHRTPLVTVAGQGLPKEWYSRSQGRLFSVNQRGDRIMANLVWELHRAGLLAGKKIGIVEDARSGGPATVDAGAVATLRDLGYTVTHRSTFAEDPSTGASQVPVEVQRMRANGVEVVLLLHGTLYSTPFAQNADSQGYRPKYYSTDWQSGATDTFAQNMPASFEGSLALTVTRSAEEHGTFGESPVDAACRRRYERLSGEAVPRWSTTAATVLSVCGVVTMFERATRSIPGELTHATFSHAMQSLGPLELTNRGHGSLRQGKFDAADHVRFLRWERACRCYKVLDDFRPSKY